MIQLFVEAIGTLGIVGVFVLYGEFLWRRKKYKSEFTRKFVHISTATFAATWPFYLSWQTITVLSIILLIGVLVSSARGIFKGVHSVERLTWGELLFAVAIGACALLTTNHWVYVAAMLHLGLADGMAAVIGTRFGKRTRYSVFGHSKSVVGSATFFVISMIIIIGFMYTTNTWNDWMLLIGLPALATLLENATVRGVDNIAVPLLVVIVLQFAV